jgi:chemotaxis protein MotB
MMRRYQARSKINDDDENADAWMMTYGDLVTQLLCFFILLMSVSVVSSMKFRKVVVSLQEALSGTGVLPAWQTDVDDIQIPNPGDIPRSLEEEPDYERMLDLKSQFDKQIKKQGMSEYVETEIRTEGLVLILRQKEPPVFFDTADARVKEEAYPILDQIGHLIVNLPNDIRIEGHTDIRPISTPQFPSNWELSITRAINVLRHLHNMGIPPDRLSAAGYGSYKPIASNETELGMSKNRRVEIAILHEVKSIDEGMSIPDISPVMHDQ